MKFCGIIRVPNEAKEPYRQEFERRLRNMGSIVQFENRETVEQSHNGIIEINKVSRPQRCLTPDLIAPLSGNIQFETAEDHAAEPIKSLETISQISDYLVKNQRYRDNMLFITGINFGLRVSDLTQLVFYRLIDDDLCFRHTFSILEKKTKNTRKVAKNRYITINDAVVDAVTLYLEHNQCKLDDYMFRSDSNHGSNLNKPLTRMSVDRILKGIAKDLNLDMHISTHSLRKTFGYHQMVMSGNDPRKLLVLQKMFGHSTAAQTLDYIGITGEEIEEAYMNLNLGSKNCYKRFSVVGEAPTSLLA